MTVPSNLLFLTERLCVLFHIEFRNCWDIKFPRRWISRGGRVTWPPHSPDLTPLDFVFWKYIQGGA